MSIEWCRVYDTGQCRVPKGLILAGEPWRDGVCHTLVGVLRHSQHGIIVFDTGVSHRIDHLTVRWPNVLYSMVVRIKVAAEGALVDQLRRDSISPKEVRYVILSHAHADHLGGLRDFPDARIVMSEAALAFMWSTQGLSAVIKAFLPELIPDDCFERAQAVVMGAGSSSDWVEVDLFGDNSIRLVSLPGHALGQLGMLIRTVNGESYFFVADACWHSDAIINGRLPHPITRLIIHDWKAMKSSLANIRHFCQQHPEYTIIPTHCPIAAQHIFTPRKQ